MNFKSLPKLEEDIRLTGNKGEYELKKFSIPVPGENLQLQGLVARPKNRTDYFHSVAHKKERIVVHHTAGQLRSDLGALTRDDFHVSVSYVIAREGTIYLMHPSRFWSGHIGNGVGNAGNAQDKLSIGIELSNYGWLVEREGNLETVYSRAKDAAGKVGPVDIYCSLAEKEAYSKLPKPYRQQSNYATFTDAQYESLIILLRYLTTKYSIPRAFMNEPERYEKTQNVVGFKGIVTHVNYRDDGKWDLGPAFNFTKVISGVQAASFVRTTEDKIAAIPTLLKSEEEIEASFPTFKGIDIESPLLEDIDFSENETEVTAPKTKPKLFALLVGIDEYDNSIDITGEQQGRGFGALAGPVKDAEKVRAMLEQDDYYEKEIILLSNKDATKPKVAATFKEHLCKAGKGDVALFYYSGHGTQEWVDMDAFPSETDGKMEGLVCYYDKQNTDDFILSDKELRWLIHEVSTKNPHIVTLFDSCHSAGVTRNAAYVNNSFPAVVEKRIPYVFPKRPWNKFAFASELTREQLIKDGEVKALPEGKHIQISACESDESAVETMGEGVFTKNLLKVLQSSQGEITYYTLRDRIRQYLRNVYEQKPRIYVAFNDDSLLYSCFLNKPFTLAKNAFAEVVYNKGALGWIVNRGAIHGLGSNITSLKVTDPDDASKTYDATIKSVRTDTSELKIEGALDISKVYKANIEGLLSTTLRVHIEQQTGDGKSRQALMDAITDEGKTIVVADEENDSQYVLRELNNKYYLTQKHQPYQPLTVPVDAADQSAPQRIIGQLKHIGSWEYIRNLKNEDSGKQLPANTLKIEVNEVGDNGKSNPIATDNNTARIEYSKKGGKWANTIRIKLTNTIDKKIYVGSLYLTTNFESFNGLLNPTVYLIGPNESVELSVKDNPELPIEFDETMKWYNKEKLTDIIKFIFSTEEFKIDDLVLDKLPPPPTPISERGTTARGIAIAPAINKNAFGWNVQELILEMINPEPGLSSDDIGIMMNNEETADFAKKLYQPKMANGKPRMKGMEEMAAPPPEMEGSPPPPPQPAPRIERGNRGFTRSKPPAPNGGGGTPKEAMTNGGGTPGRRMKNGGGHAEVAEAEAEESLETKLEKPKSAKKSAKPEKAPSLTRQGHIDYEIPGTMEVQKAADCIIQIAGLEVSAAKLKVKETSVHADIVIGNEMSVRLIDGSGGQFNITEISTARQAILPNQITKWVFRVFPKQAGRFPLLLKVTMHTDGVDKDIDVLEKEILVNAGAVQPQVADEIRRILFLAASPLNEARLRVGAEHDKINQELLSSGQRDKFVFSSMMAVTAQSIQKSIVAENPYIIHFSGHGEKEGIYVETDTGLSKLVTPNALKLLFKAAAKKVQCVLLNACYSADQAKSISETVPFVIGMQKSIKDEDALHFSTGFYQAIGAGKSIEESYELGLAAMALNSGGENIPVLLKKV